MDNILTIFTSKEQDEIKQAFKEILIENFRNEVEEDASWFFKTDDMSEYIQGMMEELIHEVKDEFKGKLKKKLFEALDKKDL